ncbi:MAG: metallophosphoesterase, partial [Actinomycetes bacterium]
MPSHVLTWAPRRKAAASVVGVLALALMAVGGAPSAAVESALTRSPYLTDSVQASVTINWATDTSASTGRVTWGPPGSCGAQSTPAVATSIKVVATPEYQWSATIPVSPDTQYCYRIYLGSVDLLGTDPSPVFTSQVAAGSTAPFSFAVFGDWGQTVESGDNTHQANVLARIASSGARFAVMTGDTAYQGGGQKEYGDLHQTGTNTSTVFGPTGWGVPGRSIPVFNVPGNHGFTNAAVQIVNWPEANAVRTSGGRYQMESYTVNGSTPTDYPSMWYAFDAGGARFYALTAAWSEANVGSGSAYQNDRDAHWTPSSPEYQWLKNDLEAHPGALKFAFWHYPLYADSANQPSDTFLQGGAGTLQGLLNAHHVAMVFNGHAHGYERNFPDGGGMVSYVLGNGGATLGPVLGPGSPCGGFDAYAIGAAGTHCGAAPAGLSNDHVYGFAKVTVSGQKVTVTPTDEMGRTYDVQTYDFTPDTQPPTPPSGVTADLATSTRVDVSCQAASDNVAVTGYRVYRNGTKVADQTSTRFFDTVVAGGTYRYAMTAVDAAGNESSPSATVLATDKTAPTAPTGLSGRAVSSGQIDLTWGAATDNIGVAAYRVYRDGALLADRVPPATAGATTFRDSSARPGTSYRYQVSALDAAANESAKSAVAIVSTPPGPAFGGGSTPGAPPALVVRGSNRRLLLRWGGPASTDPAISTYRVTVRAAASSAGRTT